MKLILYLGINLLIIALFVYIRLIAYKDRLRGGYLKTFIFFDKIFNPALHLLRKFFKPLQVGNGIAVDMAQIVLLILLLLILKYTL
ncbi:MAG: YggT family protein [Bacteroidales bacterium]|jgi:hypothetical protein|nr:YggT family protein [Bacteroidales bacterium]